LKDKLTIKKAIVSVSDKTNLDQLTKYFVKHDVHILSTGGTAKHLKKLNSKIRVQEISDFTNFQEILDGRVKTLHPLIYAGILAKRNDVKHQKQLSQIDIANIDLVVVNLYPFEKISKNTLSTDSECIENIDIGGPSMIRAAAKNYENVTILTNPNEYEHFIETAQKNKNVISLEYRKKLAALAFETTSYYESLISSWFNRKNDDLCDQTSSLPLKKITDLRYGENPHQKGSLYSLANNDVNKISGKDLSYNNIFDLEVAMELAEQFSKPSCVILKHGNPCGVALDKNQEKAYSKALKCDPVSAFGGIVAFNKTVNEKTAQMIKKIFTEVVVAPNFSPQALKFLAMKKNLILVKYQSSNSPTKKTIKSTRNFLLVQDKDNKIIKKNDLNYMSKKKPKLNEIDDMIFGFIVCKFTNSNAIVLTNNLATVGIGIGQTNRLDSAKQAIKRMKENYKKIKAVMASDGFFPFPDIVTLCAKNNVTAIIQPGGSIKDKNVVKVAEKNKISMVFAGVRHFKH